MSISLIKWRFAALRWKLPKWIKTIGFSAKKTETIQGMNFVTGTARVEYTSVEVDIINCSEISAFQVEESSILPCGLCDDLAMLSRNLIG